MAEHGHAQPQAAGETGLRGVFGRTRRPDERWEPARGWAIAAVCLCALAYVWVAWGSFAPVIPLDEIVMLGESRSLAGESPAWSLAGSGFMPGLAILLTPVWWFTADAATVYVVGLWLTVAISLVAIWPLSSLARWAGLGPNGAVIAASLVLVAPARLLLSNVMLSESLLLLTLSTALVAGLRFAQRPSVLGAALLGLASAAAFVAHGRGIVVAIAVVAWSGIYWRRLRWHGAIASLVAALASVVAFAIYRGATAGLLIGDSRTSNAVTNVLDRDLGDAIVVLIGQLWYAVFAWPAVVIVGSMLVVRRLRIQPFAALLGLIVLGSLVLSVAQVTHPDGVGPLDTWFYGRYMDPVWTILAALGVSAALRMRSWPMWLAVVGCSAIVAGLMLFVAVPHIPVGVSWRDTHILGIAPWLSTEAVVLEEPQEWLLLCVMSVVFTALAVALMVVRAALVPVLGAAWLSLAVAYDTGQIDGGSGTRSIDADPLGMAAIPADQTVGVDAAVRLNLNPVTFASDGRTVILVDLEAGDAVPDVVYASILAAPARDAGARVLETSAGGALVAWIYPGDLYDQLDAEGLLLPEGEVFTPPADQTTSPSEQ